MSTLIMILFLSILNINMGEIYAQNKSREKRSTSRESTDKKEKGYSSHVLNFKSKVGIGFTQTLGGIEGLALQRGVNRSVIVEGVFGGTFIKPEEGQIKNLMGFALGAHFLFIQARDVAALSVGLRYNYILGNFCLVDQGRCQAQLENATEFTESVVDLPIRVMWFPNHYLSLHMEFGINLQFNSDSDSLSEKISSRGYRINLFRDHLPFGQFGLTLWI